MCFVCGIGNVVETAEHRWSKGLAFLGCRACLFRGASSPTTPETSSRIQFQFQLHLHPPKQRALHFPMTNHEIYGHPGMLK